MALTVEKLTSMLMNLHPSVKHVHHEFNISTNGEGSAPNVHDFLLTEDRNKPTPKNILARYFVVEDQNGGIMVSEDGVLSDFEVGHNDCEMNLHLRMISEEPELNHYCRTVYQHGFGQSLDFITHKNHPCRDVWKELLQ